MGIPEQIEPILRRHTFFDYRWLDPAAIRLAEWVRIKCQFGCPHFGRAAVCPPNAPSVDDCRRFFAEYRHALIFHFQATHPSTAARRAWSAQTNRSLVAVERDIFVAGFPKALALFTDACHLCEECVPRKADCREPLLARPSATAMAVDVLGTAHGLGYPTLVAAGPTDVVNYYAFLMVD